MVGCGADRGEGWVGQAVEGAAVFVPEVVFGGGAEHLGQLCLGDQGDQACQVFGVIDEVGGVQQGGAVEGVLRGAGGVIGDDGHQVAEGDPILVAGKEFADGDDGVRR
ncbi:hypothetical protein NONI108955_42825 [Nocardia ninae]